MSRKPFSRKRQRIFEGASVVCPMCNGKGYVEKIWTNFRGQQRSFEPRCRLCKHSGRVFPQEAMEYLLSQP